MFGWISERAWPRFHGDIPGDPVLAKWTLALGFDFLLALWIPFWVQFGINDNGTVPDFVYAIIIVENALYASFGVVFVVIQMCYKDSPVLFAIQEITYTTLSLVAKTTLSFLIVFPAAVSF